MAGLDFIPGVREAELKFRDEQLESFAGVEPDICGCMKVKPLTPQMFVELSGSGNGFFNREQNGGNVTPIDVAVFLWRVSEGFDPNDAGKRQSYNLFVAVLDFESAVKEILAYIQRSWAAMPQWTGGNTTTTSAGVWPSRLVDMFASEYGWSEQYVLNLPFRRLWQYANRILERKDENYTHKCPEALRLRQKWLEAQNTPPESPQRA